METGGRLQAPTSLTTEQNPNTFWIWDWVSPTAGLKIFDEYLHESGSFCWAYSDE